MVTVYVEAGFRLALVCGWQVASGSDELLCWHWHHHIDFGYQKKYLLMEKLLHHTREHMQRPAGGTCDAVLFALFSPPNCVLLYAKAAGTTANYTDNRQYRILTAKYNKGKAAKQTPTGLISESRI